ncbi:MAG: hypothetical protein HN842_02230 [Gammaproteobacteria bacterium]|jgi:hypothetical protein|nr:hypothetical protein [Gammaproteobacteria bacterium]
MRLFLRFIDDLPLSIKLGGMLLPLFLLMVVMVMDELGDETERIQQAERVVEVVGFVEKVSDVVHHLAVERGLSAGVVGGAL